MAATYPDTDVLVFGADPVRVDPRFMADPAKLDKISGVIMALWPEAIAPGDLASAALVRDVQRARTALLEALDLDQLI